LNEAVLLLALDNLDGAFVVVDERGFPQFTSAALEPMLGPWGRDAPVEGWVARSGALLADRVTPCSSEEFPIARALCGDASELQLFLPRPPGGLLLSVTGRPLRDSAGKLRGALGVFREISIVAPADAPDEGGRAHDRPAPVEPSPPEFAEQILDAVALPIFVKDRAFRFAFVNQALCRMLGFDRERMLGRSDYDFFPREQSDFFRRKDAETFDSGEAVVIDEEPITDAAGALHFLATTKVPLRDGDGVATHLVGIIQDITRRKEAEDARRRAAERAEAANQELEAFSYSVSHDLRSPLRTIEGFSQALLEDHAAQLDEAGHDHLRRVCSATQRMNQLIDDLLRLSKVTRAELHRAQVDLSSIGRQVAEDLRRSDPARQVELVVQPGLLAEGDSRLVRVILENLLGNAWKFTSRKARARVELGQAPARGPGDPGEIGSYFFVSDDGVGFDGALASELFAPFRRLHAASEFPGTGVGLATVRRIVHRHGGQVWARSAPGKGTTLCFTLSEGGP
jgi:PAS domain S-box-containing protein